MLGTGGEICKNVAANPMSKVKRTWMPSTSGARPVEKCGVLRLTLSQLLPLHPTNLALISGASHTGERARSRRLTEVNTLEAFLGKDLCKINPTTPVILTSEN